MAAFKDITGLTFGYWTVISRDRSDRSSRWNCTCKCGESKSVYTSHLISGASRSCGCYSAQRASIRATKHDMVNSKEYSSWRAAKERCSNPKGVGFARYGGRGITMCDRWRDSFAAFYEDMGPQPTGYTLERIDSNGNYDPCNCKWASWPDQQNNRRDCIRITHEGRTLTLKQWSRVTGINYGTLKSRNRTGTPLFRKVDKRFTHN